MRAVLFFKERLFHHRQLVHMSAVLIVQRYVGRISRVRQKYVVFFRLDAIKIESFPFGDHEICEVVVALRTSKMRFFAEDSVSEKE